MPNFDLARIQSIFDAADAAPPAGPVAVQNTALALPSGKGLATPRTKTFAELYRPPSSIERLAAEGVFDDPALRTVPLTNAAAAAQARHVLAKVANTSGIAATSNAVNNIVAAAARREWSLMDIFEQVFQTPPRTMMEVMAQSPNAPNPSAIQTFQWSGPTAAVAVPAGATVVASWQPSKSFRATNLAITAGANANTDQDDLAVGAITIAGSTYSNSGIVPSLIYRPSSNTVPGVPNFAGPFVAQNSTINVSLTNTGADPLSVIIGMGGPTNG